MSLDKRLQKLETQVEESFTDRSAELRAWFDKHKGEDLLEMMENFPSHLGPTLRSWIQPRLDREKNAIIRE